jgi:catechol 2,3-dioxygenase-like lactoylglutathione lyase family enzyme
MLKLAVFFATCLLMAQLPPPNQSGVAMGHLHLKVRDVEAQKKFWIELGAKPAKLGSMDLMKLPDLLVLIQSGEPSGGTEGSVVGHVGLKVRDLKPLLARLKAAGIKGPKGEISFDEKTRGAFVLAPEGVSVELMEDPALTVPVANHHIHFYNGAVDQTKAWYVKTFGAKPGRRANFEAADLPGVNLTFAAADTPTAGTKGRTLDHIGFEVKNLEAFCKKLEAAGIKFDVPYRKVPSLGISLAFLTDPWGTYIELTEGLDKL